MQTEQFKLALVALQLIFAIFVPMQTGDRQPLEDAARLVIALQNALAHMEKRKLDCKTKD